MKSFTGLTHLIRILKYMSQLHHIAKFLLRLQLQVIHMISLWIQEQGNRNISHVFYLNQCCDFQMDVLDRNRECSKDT